MEGVDLGETGTVHGCFVLINANVQEFLQSVEFIAAFSGLIDEFVGEVLCCLGSNCRPICEHLPLK